MAHNNRNWPDFIKKLPAWITGLITFVTAVVGFIKLWQGDTGLVSIVLLAVGVGGGTLGCAFLAFKRTLPLVEGGKGIWQYPRWRPWAQAGLIVIPLLTAGGVGYHLYQQALPPNKVILLVADFDGPEPQKYRVTETVWENLSLALKKYDDVQVERLERVFKKSSDACAEGENHKAAIVIWGWYGTTEAAPLSVHFEVLDPPKHMPALGPEAEGQVRTMAVDDLESFALQPYLSAEMTYLSLFAVGMTRYAAEDWDSAIIRFSDALSQTLERVSALDQSTAYFYRGVACAAKGDYDLAIADYNQAIKLKPDLDEAYNNRGVAYAAKGDYDLAIADYNQAIQLQPHYAEAYNNRGIAHYEFGNVAQAIRDYDKAIQLNPALVRIYNNRGLAHARSGHLAQAIRDFGEAIKLSPDYANAYNNRGIAYYESGNLEQAIRDYDKTIELNPALAGAYYNRGIAHYESDDVEQAVRDFDKAIELNPDYVDAYFNRGKAQAESGNLEQAIRDFEQYLRLAPNAPDGEIVMNAIEQLKSELSP